MAETLQEVEKTSKVLYSGNLLLQFLLVVVEVSTDVVLSVLMLSVCLNLCSGHLEVKGKR